MADAARPRLSPVASLLCGAIALILGVVLFIALWTHQPLDYLDDPIGTMTFVAERDLDMLEALDGSGPAIRGLWNLFSMGAMDERGELLNAYARLDAYLGEWTWLGTWGHDAARPFDDEREEWAAEISKAFDPGGFYWRYALLAAEEGRLREAVAAVDKFDALHPATGFARLLPDAVTRQILDPLPSTPDAFLSGMLPPEQPGAIDWSTDEIRMRAARLAGDLKAATRIEAERLARGRGLLVRATLFALAWFLPILCGGLVLLYALVFRHAPHPLSGGLVRARWSFRYGLHVLLRSVALMLLVYMGLPDATLRWGSLFGGLPLLLLAQLYLAHPDRSSVWRDYGFRIARSRWGSLAAVSFMVIAIDQAGAMTLGLLGQWAGLAFPWEEALDESLLFGGAAHAFLDAVDGIIWAPLFEEFAFRGVLYVTLRRRFRPLAAAAVSGALFSAVHLYSMIGFLQLLWSGVVLAIAYERTRSLWPCILAHAFHNLGYYTIMLLLYRSAG